MSGLDLQTELARRSINIPTIIITAHEATSDRFVILLAGLRPDKPALVL